MTSSRDSVEQLKRITRQYLASGVPMSDVVDVYKALAGTNASAYDLTHAFNRVVFERGLAPKEAEEGRTMTHAQMVAAVRASETLADSRADRHNIYPVRVVAAVALDKFPALGSKADNEKRAA